MDSFFDSSRKKFVAATPEEAVRQAVVSWLKDVQKVPGHLIETEFALRLFDPRNADRVDILVHDFREGANAKEPWLLVECKRPGVESPAALQVQVNKYLRILKPKFIMLSLGETAIFLKLDSQKKTYVRIPTLPIYPPTNP
ncbi:MAG: type I restriction enzyme HsdR N-terminal domain-containing protein [Fibrobacter sp.]|nr:type I restriction enzyme HsdR N-terminal domain-containing protein [Fibrobacter sp.]MDY6369344.1 type I restriction enzyme HsdR N-terminal domain-containing protein [Fibrobacter sp.]MDY6389021.1 type I restriction enzyme HsdR N-terminal domain-containing protein [Fibrobacter sp.]